MLSQMLIVSLLSLTSASASVISWNTPDGIERLSASKHKVDFFKLANHFESQTNKFFCGPTSAAITLNALRVRNSNYELPQDNSLLTDANRAYLSKSRSPLYQRYTQNNVLDKSPKARAFVLGKPVTDKNGQSKKRYWTPITSAF